MILQLLMVKDRAVNAFVPPMMTMRRNEEAVRIFTGEVNREGSIFGAHPDDYDLYCVGQLDDETGVVRADNILCVVRGKDVFRQSSSDA